MTAGGVGEWVWERRGESARVPAGVCTVQGCRLEEQAGHRAYPWLCPSFRLGLPTWIWATHLALGF